MTILTKIISHRDLYNQVFLDLLTAVSISEYTMGGERYIRLSPFQAAVLQKLGVGMDFYETSVSLSPLTTLVPDGITLEKKILEPTAGDQTVFTQFVHDLEKKLKHTPNT